MTTTLLDKARQIAKPLQERAAEIEKLRTLPPDLVEDLRAAGLFGLMTPRHLGGAEAEPRRIVEVIEELSRADASTGWVAMVGQGAGFLAWMPSSTAARVVDARPDPIIVSSLAPTGAAVPCEGGLSLTGRWPYASGCRIADMMFGGFLAGPPNGGPPPLRLALLPSSGIHVHDTWHVSGLRGSGSHDVEAAGIEVPGDHVIDPFGPAVAEGALYRLPYMSYLLVAIAGFPLGVARRIVDEYMEVALAKRTAERRLMAETPLVQGDIARCDAAVRAARAGVFAALDDLWAEANAGAVTVRSRARFTGSVQHALNTALTVADTAFRACGASQLYDKAPLQRLFRDVQAAAQHIAFGQDSQRRVGAALLGRDVVLPFL
ncbi:acyl-CoA dehydrogenase family protein [Streptomyces eurythermus]